MKIKGVYRSYIVEITFRVEDKIGFTYTGLTEYFCRDTDNWEYNKDFILKKFPICQTGNKFQKMNAANLKAGRFFRLIKLSQRKCLNM